MKRLISRFRAAAAELSPERAALIVSLGLVIGVFPIAGCPTILCFLAAFGFRLNVAALQAVNSISTPIQLALLLPLEQAGARICGGAMGAGVSPAGRIAVLAIHAVTGWGCICVPAGILFYSVLIVAIRSRAVVRLAAAAEVVEAA